MTHHTRCSSANISPQVCAIQQGQSEERRALHRPPVACFIAQLLQSVGCRQVVAW